MLRRTEVDVHGKGVPRFGAALLAKHCFKLITGRAEAQGPARKTRQPLDGWRLGLSSRIRHRIDDAVIDGGQACCIRISEIAALDGGRLARENP